MLAHGKLPKAFWAEVLTTTTYVINRSPSVPLDRHKGWRIQRERERESSQTTKFNSK